MFLYNVNIFSIEKFIIKPFAITIDISRDFYPAVSIKHNYIVYVSDKTGNLDLWLYDIKTRNNFRLTYHSSDDTMPSFSPDGKKLVFISYRSDSTGDVWALDIDQIEERARAGLDEDELKELLRDDGAEPLVLSPYPESEPKFMPDNRYILFVREDKNGLKNIYLKKARLNADEKQLTYNGAVSLAPAPDGNSIAYIDVSTNTAHKAHIFLLNLKTLKKTQITSGNSIESSPHFINKHQLVYSSIKFDYNHNGKIELNDNSALYIYNLKTKKEIQITSGKFYDTNPVYARFYKGVVIFSSTRQNNVDIWMLPISGIIPDFTDEEKQFKIGFNLNDKYFRITAFKKFIYRFPESTHINEAKYQIARALAQLGFIRDSNKYLEQILSEQTNITTTYVRARIQLILNRHKNVTKAIEKLIALKKEIFDEKQKLNIDFSIASLYLKLNKISESIKYYENIIKNLEIDEPLATESRKKLVQIYASLNQYTGIETVLKNYSASTNFKLKLDFHNRFLKSYFVTIPDIQKDSEYRKLIKVFKYDKDYYLNTKFRYTLSLIKRNKLKKARAVLEQIIDEDTTEYSYFKFLAYTKISEITTGSEKKEYLFKAINIKLPECFKEQSEQAKLNLVAIMLEEAQENFNKKNYLNAKKIYQSILKISPENIPAIAGKIRCDFRIIPPSEEKYNKILSRYKNLSQKMPYEYTYHYILGYGYSLIYSYYFQYKREEEKILQKYFNLAEKELQIAYRLRPDLIESYLTLGWLYQLQDELKDKSDRKFLEEAIPLYFSALHYNDENKNPYNEAMLCLNLANIYFKLQNYSAAYKYYEKKLKYYKGFQTPIQEAFFYYHFGYSAWFIEKDNSARKNFLKAYKSFMRCNEKYYALISLIYVAMIDRITGNYTEAIQNYQKAIKFIETYRLDINPERLYREIGICYQKLNQPETALRYFFKAEKIIPKDPELSFWQRPAVRIHFMNLFSIPVFPVKLTLGASFAYQGFKNRDEQKLLYSLISETYFNSLNYLKSLQFLLKKKVLLEDDKNIDALPPLYNQIALVYYKLNNLKKAEEYFRLSNKYNRKSKKTRDDKGIVINNLNLAEIIMRQQKDVSDYFDDVKELLDESIEIIEKMKKKKDKKLLVEIYSLYGLLYYKYAEKINLNKKYDRSIKKTLRLIKADIFPYINAVKYYNRAYNLAVEYKMRDVATKIRFNVGMVYFNSYDYEKAKEIFQECRNNAERYFLKEIEWKSKYLLSKIDNTLKKYADDIVDIIITQPKGYNYAINNDPLIKIAFDDIIEMYVNQTNYLKAVETIEKYKNFKIKEIFNSYPVAIKKRDKDIYSEFKNLEHKILGRITAFHKSLRKKKKLSKKYFSFLNEIEKLYKEREDLSAKIQKENPQLLYYLYNNIVPITDIQKLIPENEIVLQFYITKTNVNTILITSDELNVFTTNFSENELHRLVNNFYEAVVDRDSDYVLYAERLYNILIAPLEDKITEAGNIRVIPDTFLYKIPFSLLFTNKSVMYEISLSQFYFNKNKKTQVSHRLLVLNSDSELYKLKNVKPLPEKDIPQKSLRKFLMHSDIIHIPDGIKINSQIPVDFKLYYNEEYVLNSVNISDLEKFPELISIERIENLNSLNENTINGVLVNLYYSGASTVLIPLWNIKEKYLYKFWNNFYTSTQNSFIEKYNYAKTNLRKKYEKPFYYESKAIFGKSVIISEDIILTKEKEATKIRDIQFFITNGDRSFRTNEYEDAIENYYQAYQIIISQSNIVTNERLFQIIDRIVQSYIAMDEQDDALEWAEKGAEFFPEKFNRFVAQISFKLKEYDRALSYITNVKSETPEDYIIKAQTIALSDLRFDRKWILLNQVLSNRIADVSQFTNKKEFFDVYVDFLIENDALTNLYDIVNTYKNLIAEPQEYSVGMITLTNIQQVLQTNTLFCDLYLSPEYLIVFYITKSNISFNIEKIKRINKIMENFSNSIIESSEEDLNDTLNDFYDLFFKHIDLSKFSNIYIFPEGMLLKIPFNALYDGKNYLIDGHFVITISSYKGIYSSEQIKEFRIAGIGYRLNLPGKVIRDFSYKELEEIKYLYPQSYTIINEIRLPKEEFSVFHIALKSIISNNRYYFIVPGFTESTIQSDKILIGKRKKDLIFLSKFDGIKVDKFSSIIYDLNRYTYRSIINLYRTSDINSALFVKRFYRNLKEVGKLYQAFYLTQKQIRTAYRNPLLWSNFIFCQNISPRF